MGSSGAFFVDPGALSSAHDRVGRLSQQLGEFGEIGPDHPASVFGHDELAESAKEFLQRWRDGVRELAGEVDAIHQRLGDTIDVYRRVDSDVAAEFRRLRGGS